MKLTVVIPTYNEAGTVLDLVAGLRATVGQEASLIIVDDASPDGTAALVRELGDHRITVIERAGKQGIGSAYQVGFQRALLDGADWILQMDADLSHDPADASKLLVVADQNDVVIGSRYIVGGKIVGWGPWRHFCSRGAMVFARLCLRLSARDVTSGYRLWRATLLRDILAQPVASDGYAFQEEMLYRAQQRSGRIIEVPITFTDRRVGKSKLGWREVVEFFIVMLRLR